MTRATLTVLRGERLVRWPPPGEPLDLLQNEPNVVANADDAFVFVEANRRVRLHFAQRRGQWSLRTFTDDVAIDGAPALLGGDVALRGGEHITLLRRVGDAPLIELRFDVVTAAPLERLRVVGGQVLIDCAGVAGPGRWFALGRGRHRLEESLLVASRPRAARRVDDDDDDGGFVGEVDPGLFEHNPRQNEASVLPEHAVRFADDGAIWRLYRRVPRGLSLRELCARGPGVEPAVAVAVLAHLAARVALRAPRFTVSVDHVWLGWDGSLRLLPPVIDVASDNNGRGLLVELFTHLLPETSAWWSDSDVGSVAARDLWHRMVGPYLGGLAQRPRQSDDVVAPAQIEAACASVTPLLRPVNLASELSGIARGLCAEEWRAEEALAEELALVDDAGFDALVARALR